MTRPVLLVATGDTIAHGSAGVATGKELLELAGPPPTRVVVEDVMAEPSWDTSTSTQLALGRRVRKALAEDEFAGVVVTHGIDTLEDTAFLADLMVGPAAVRGGIVFTGAVRALADSSADGPGNIADALAAAAEPALRGAGAVVCMGGELHAARWATLTDPTRPAAFTSAPRQLLGRVMDGQVNLIGMPPSRPPRPRGEPESDVALIKTYPDMPASLLTLVTDAGARGVVLEGTGAGNVPVEMFAMITELTRTDIPVVVASRVPANGIGLVGELGAIGARGLPPNKARIALMAALGDGGGVVAARTWFGEL
ncbi:MAG: asparaginase [Actinophytocola sp.]|uniref:asparaginase domain-containing protein n=1 Tax=Actinophytocola sp. TaxID=1872138 RepID=UPI00132385C8|nr:asparaginase domain-containing protein [Actinophytocola sp.]MPZ83579.1 asparaginase [Actinophytocola sp.]